MKRCVARALGFRYHGREREVEPLRPRLPGRRLVPRRPGPRRQGRTGPAHVPRGPVRASRTSGSRGPRAGTGAISATRCVSCPWNWTMRRPGVPSQFLVDARQAGVARPRRCPVSAIAASEPDGACGCASAPATWRPSSPGRAGSATLPSCRAQPTCGRLSCGACQYWRARQRRSGRAASAAAHRRRRRRTRRWPSKRVQEGAGVAGSAAPGGGPQGEDARDRSSGAPCQRGPMAGERFAPPARHLRSTWSVWARMDSQ